MRLASFRVGGQDRFGIVAPTGLIDVSERVSASDLKTVIGHGAAALEPFRNAPSDWSFDDVTWLPPVTNPTHVIGIGLNTKSHFEETAELMRRVPGDYPAYPRLFTRSPLSHVGHGQALLVPEVSDQLDYEGEIALVMGRPCRYVPAEKAMDHVAGYACYNDGSVRDFQTHSSQTTAGKNFPSSGAFGPWLVTADEIPDPSRLTLRTRVNGQVRQQLDMADLIFGFAELVAYVSQVFELRPGDTILTGSPAGIGALSQNWLRAGDRVEIEIPDVGVLSNPVTNERRP
ncbi:fumarylacetoacetate hydrolase family protein [Streptomyces sp. SID12501]|uniref:Fumarylacetoacetate hydrolase family protein n=1 Tax=Streptomyces sp. SID12501 TaxID=2706042 RepID=A0A6B3BH87_9ACTN|nr:fumarylacetoacetate hydrolase family protein [Streptomyces sp. SID12501]NEC85081.1 fumarylacetoacetate hydrolase family protein [Streptomyces sp. SID12501]